MESSELGSYDDLVVWIYKYEKTKHVLSEQGRPNQSFTSIGDFKFRKKRNFTIL